MNCIKGKPALRISENKGADQLFTPKALLTVKTILKYFLDTINVLSHIDTY